MGAVFFGIVILFLSFILIRFHTETSEKINLKPWAWATRILATLFIIIGLLASTIIIIPAGYRGVLLQSIGASV